MANRTFGPYTVQTSNEDKVLFPDAGITKGHLISYYEKIAPTMLPHVEDRPLSMRRFPDGIDREGFFQKQVPDHFPDWIASVRVTKEGGKQDLVACNNTATLVYLADQACITPHVWLSRSDRLRNPDQLIIDLDPPDDREPGARGFAAVRRAALRVRGLLEDLDLPSFVKTTGSRGLHVMVPLDRSDDFKSVRSLARALSKVLVEKYPDQLTTEQRKNRREGRLYLDVGRNAYGQTAVAPYAVRARPGAPVATPLDWDELNKEGLRSDTFTIRNIFRRLGQKPDPWARCQRRAVSLSTAEEKLQKLRS